MVTVHPVGLPHGPKPRALEAFMDGRRTDVHNEVGIMADFANPTQISDWALGLSEPSYMGSWGALATAERFAYSPTRLDEIRAVAERLAGARDELRPPDS
jgi:homogentisate 1,2-dioxygenase